MTRHLVVSVVLAWTLYGMYQDGGRADGYWWKPFLQYKTGEECRTAVKEITQRPIVGLIQWYLFPVSDKSPKVVGDVMKLKPVGGANPWVGCLPSDYDPYERR